MTIDNKRKRSLKEPINKANKTESATLSGVVCNSLFNKLVVNVSDKLRSPLFVIKSYAQLLQKTQDEHRLKRGFELMEVSAIRMEKTITELINLVDIYTNEIPERELVFFREIYEKTQLNLYNLFDSKQLSIDTDFSEHAKIWFIKPFLEIILTQLLSNAIIHNSDHDDLQIKVSTYKLLNSIVLQVEDNGYGFDSSQLKEQVRDPFNTQNELAQCVGVGLSKVDAIAKVSNSVFEIESKPQEGTICRFYFRQ